jgi:hypothetical protein
MPFGSTNAQASFQAYIDNYLPHFIDDFAGCYLDDILINSTDEEHEEQVRKLLEWLREFGLYGKAQKCHFGVTEVHFLGFVIRPDEIGRESGRK